MNQLYSLLPERTVQGKRYDLTVDRPVCVSFHAFMQSEGERPDCYEELMCEFEEEKLVPEEKHEIVPHDHDHFELMLILGGKGVHHTQHYMADVSRGDFILVAPGQTHAFEHMDSLCRVECEYFSTWITHEAQDLWLEDGVLPLFFMPDNATDAAGLSIIQHRLSEKDLRLCLYELRAMASELAEDRPSLPYLRRCMGKLMITLGRSYAKATGIKPPREISFDIVSALQAIEKYAFSNEQFRVSHLAKQSGLSVSHFTHQFVKYVGVSPSQYFQNRRIQHASWLLLYSQDSVTDITYLLGFCDTAHFERVFYKRRGMTPLAYRKRFAGKPAEQHA
jgi:AraC-like DNA-binding protein/mannose-6-phosphate isomerase-like protein (cupin superfamily)